MDLQSYCCPCKTDPVTKVYVHSRCVQVHQSEISAAKMLFSSISGHSSAAPCANVEQNSTSTAYVLSDSLGWLGMRMYKHPQMLSVMSSINHSRNPCQSSQTAVLHFRQQSCSSVCGIVWSRCEVIIILLGKLRR